MRVYPLDPNGAAAGVALMTGVQWHSFLKDKAGTRSWRGRTLDAAAGERGWIMTAEGSPVRAPDEEPSRTRW